MKPVDGYFLIKPEDLQWRPSNLMRIPNADFLERTKSEILGARLWRLPPNSANTLHEHIMMMVAIDFTGHAQEWITACRSRIAAPAEGLMIRAGQFPQYEHI